MEEVHKVLHTTGTARRDHRNVYDLTNRIIAAGERAGCDYAVDLFFRYGSDAGQAVRAGNNLRAAAFGMGVYASHGVERTHINGIENTTRLMLSYILEG